MENINIGDFKDYKNVTIAEYNAAKSEVEQLFMTSIKQGKIKNALKYAVLYIQLDKLLNKRLVYGARYGYDGNGRSK